MEIKRRKTTSELNDYRKALVYIRENTHDLVAFRKAYEVLGKYCGGDGVKK